MAKQVKISKKLVKAVETLLSSRAEVEKIRPIVEGYQTKILAENQWSVDDGWADITEQKIVTDPNMIEYLSNEDMEDFIDQCSLEMIKNGLKVKKRDQCPLLVAKHAVKMAEVELLNQSAYITRLTSDRWWKIDIRNRAISLVIGLVEAHNRESSR